MTTAVEASLEQYLLEAELECSDWFTLYRGRYRNDSTPIFIKLAAPLLACDEFLVHRFKHLTKQAAQLEHPNILPTSEAKQEGDLLYIIQNFIQAPSLAQVIQGEGPFSLQRTRFIAGQIASALDYAHQKSLPHGDLSARQIYLEPEDRVFISNFGQSQAVLGSKLMPQDFASISAETIAPERVQGQGPSRPADLYALGILCYQMLAKKPPFTGPVSSVLYAQAHKQVPSLHQINPAVPLAVSEVIERMLSKSVELRYNTGAEFVRALTAACHLQKSPRQYEYLVPLAERERTKPLNFKTIIRLISAVVLSLLITTLSAWAGYELGLKQRAGVGTSHFILVNSTIPTPTRTPETRLTASVIFTPGSGIPSTPQTSVSDTLLLTRTVLSNVLRLAASPTPSPGPLPPTATPSPAVSLPPALPVPDGQGLFIFHNPTGHDLIVDLTGPTNVSALVPPEQRHEFLLEPGTYQYMVHTPTGRWLNPVVAYFELGLGQALQKDYYSDYDWTKK